MFIRSDEYTRLLSHITKLQEICYKNKICDKCGEKLTLIKGSKHPKRLLCAINQCDYWG